MPLLHQLTEMAQKQGAQQGGDMQPVRVRVGQDTDLAEAQGSTSQVLRILPRSGMIA